MKVYNAKYDPAYNTADNSLVNNMLKYPEIAKKIIELYPRYSMTYLLERLGFGASEKVIGGSSFEWKIMQRYKAPAGVDVAYAVNASVGTVGTLKIQSDTTTTGVEEYCMLTVNDVVRFECGATALVTAVGSINTAADGNTDVTIKHIDAFNFSATGASAAVTEVVAVIGSAYGQGSLGDEVGEGYAYPETHRNHLTLSRRKCKINGIDLHDVTWVEHNGHRLWYFTKEQQMTDQFMYELELNRWFGKSSVSGDITYPGDAGAVANGLPIMGDGILAQIASANQFSTAGNGVTEGELLKFIGTLSLSSLKATGNEYVVFTGMQGMIQFQQAMTAHLATMGSASSLIASKSGEGVAVGTNFTSYSALGNNIKLVHNPCFDDPNVATMTSGISGTGFNTSQLSGLMVVMDMSVQDGVANVELISKGAEGYNRNYVKKYVPGMINPNDPSSMMAANGNDTFECHILSESGIIIRNPQSCGVIMPAGLTI
tara:strand:- start:584 stop:2041 length:1458 start_codon:yes stop_codon:yes gene_type:complete